MTASEKKLQLFCYTRNRIYHLNCYISPDRFILLFCFFNNFCGEEMNFRGKLTNQIISACGLRLLVAYIFPDKEYGAV